MSFCFRKLLNYGFKPLGPHNMEINFTEVQDTIGTLIFTFFRFSPSFSH